MKIIRQKEFATGAERALAKYTTCGKNIRPNAAAQSWNRRCAAKTERFKRTAVNSVVDVVNNPVGGVVDLGKNLASRPMETAGKVLIAVPFPASVPAGAAMVAGGKQLRSKVKGLGNISEKIRSGIESTDFYKKIKGINLGILRPYKQKQARLVPVTVKA